MEESAHDLPFNQTIGARTDEEEKSTPIRMFERDTASEREESKNIFSNRSNSNEQSPRYLQSGFQKAKTMQDVSFRDMNVFVESDAHS